MLPHPLTNFEIQMYYQKNAGFNGLLWTNKLPEIKDGEFVINFDEYRSMWTHWIALYVNGDNASYFDMFWVVYIPKEIKKIIGNENIMTNIYRIQTFDSVISGHFCIGLILWWKVKIC